MKKQQAQHDFEQEAIRKECEREKEKLRERVSETQQKYNLKDEDLTKLKEDLEKYKKSMRRKEYEFQIKISENETKIGELKKVIRELTIPNIDRQLGNIEASVDHSIALRVNKSQVGLTEKNSETVLYGGIDGVSDNSFLEPVYKAKHKRRPSSLSSAERVYKSKLGLPLRDNSPNNADVTYLDESYISRTILHEVDQSYCLEEYQPEREINSYSNNAGKCKISTSYLEEDYEDEYVPKTHRDSNNHSRSKHTHEYRPSPVPKTQSSTTLSRPSQKPSIQKAKSSKRINPKNADTLTNVLSPSELGVSFKVGELGEGYTYDLGDRAN